MLVEGAKNITLSTVWKQRIARLVRSWPVRTMLAWGILLFTPRHRVGVGLVIMNKQQQILLLRHVFHPHYPWGLPGGWLAKDEDPAAGALRELEEETGLTAVLGPVIHLHRQPTPSHLGIAFLGSVQPGPITLSGEIIEAAWLKPDELPPLLPFAKAAIANALAYVNGMEETAVFYTPENV